MDGVVEVVRNLAGVDIVLQSGQTCHFDQVVLACHSDEALNMLRSPTQDEQNILGSILYKKNTAYVHSDKKQLPSDRKVWAAWNYCSNTPVGQGLITLVPYVCII
jgi:predicted NAD/FAD-binding protein